MEEDLEHKTAKEVNVTRTMEEALEEDLVHRTVLVVNATRTMVEVTSVEVT